MVRISGPGAGSALTTLCGTLPKSRRATFRTLRGRCGDVLDEGLVLWLPGPATATGEHLAELHLHGGCAVVAAVLAELEGLDGLRPALAGEFTRRGFENGRIDLAQAEGLADLLTAETDSQRRSALALTGGALGKLVETWQLRILQISAGVEAALDLSDEADVDERLDDRVHEGLFALVSEISDRLDSPPAERLKDGVMVVLAGPPNAGKSRLINALAERDVAIVASEAGTTRDRIEVPVAIEGVPLVLTDTAGLRVPAPGSIEAIGIGLAEEAIGRADIVLWLGDHTEAPKNALVVSAKCDLGIVGPGLAVSAVTGQGLAALKQEILVRARALLPRTGDVALNRRHRAILATVLRELNEAGVTQDLLIVAEHLRAARNELDRLTGRAGVENMLDALFGTFCIGK